MRTAFLPLALLAALAALAVTAQACLPADPLPSQPTVDDGFSYSNDLAPGANDRFKIYVPDDATFLQVRTTGPPCNVPEACLDVDLYVRYNAPPTDGAYNCRPYLVSPTETCYFSNPTQGWWYIRVYGYSEDPSDPTLEYTLSVTRDGTTNRDPTAVPDSFLVDAGTTKDLDVAANDMDPDPARIPGALDDVQVTAVTPASSLGSPVTVVSGLARFAATGAAGLDSFGYTLEDGCGGTATGTVSVTVNAPPTAAADTATLTTQDPESPIGVLANDADAFYSDLSGPVAAPQLRVLDITAAPTLGSARVAPDGSDVLYTPGAGGTDTLTYTVTDGRLTATADVTIEVGNPTAPTLDALQALTVVTGFTATIDAAHLSASHPEEDPLTYRLDSDPALGALALGSTQITAPATFTQDDIDAGLITYASSGPTGADGFNFTVLGPFGMTVSDTFPITVVPITPPTAGISVSEAPHFTSQTVTFLDTSTPGTFPISDRTWDFGDGTAQATGAAVGHSYNNPGTYTVTLTVADGTSTDSKSVKIKLETFRPATADFRASASTAYVGDQVTFTSTAKPGSVPIETLEWDFFDAVPPGEDLYGEVVGHAFTRPGGFLVTLTVIDEAGRRVHATHVVTVLARPEAEAPPAGAVGGDEAGITDPPPVADAGTDQVALHGTVVRLDGTASRSLTGNALRYAWQQADGPHVDLHRADTATPMFAVPWTDASETELFFRLTVDDGLATSQEDLVRVLVRPNGTASAATVPPPVAAFKRSLTPEGNHSFAAAAQDLPGMVYLWDFGDGTTAEGREVEHRFTGERTYTVRLTVRDAFGREATRAADVDLSPPVPLAEDPAPVETPAARTGMVLLWVAAAVLGAAMLAGGAFVLMSWRAGRRR